MPEISRFFGIVIGMFYADHGVPHFHAVYGPGKASISIVAPAVLDGALPRRALRLVLEWARLHERELLANWERLDAASRSSPSPRWSHAMEYDVVEARHVRRHIRWLRFRDGTAGEIDLAPALLGPIMAPLKDLLFFRACTIHPEFHTLVWPDAADFAPEFLHDNVRVRV